MASSFETTAFSSPPFGDKKIKHVREKIERGECEFDAGVVSGALQ